MNWKSTYGVSDEGASAAGVYGTPNSTWDIARAQQATQDLYNARNTSYGGAAPSYTSYSTPSYTTSSSVGTGYYPSYSPPSALGSAIRWVGGLISRVIAITALMAIGLSVLAVVVFALTGFLTLPSTSGVNTAELRNVPIEAPSYATENPMVLELAGIPASTLYNTYLKDTPPNWNRLNGRHRAAVEAAWLRYLQDPEAFYRLEKFSYFRQVFDGYLLHRGHVMQDPIPLLDRGRFASMVKPFSELKSWSEGSIMLPDDPDLAALAMDATFWEQVGHCVVRGAIWWAELFTDTDVRLNATE